MKNSNIFLHFRSLILSVFLIFVSYLVYSIFFSSKEVNIKSEVENEYLIGQKIDHITAYELDAAQYSYDFSDEKVILHFWASWCSPCVSEMPELIQFAAKNKDIKIITISQDSDGKEALAFMKSFPEMKRYFINLHDSKRELAKQFNVSKLPETIIINKNSYIKKISGSIHWSQIEAFDALVK